MDYSTDHLDEIVKDHPYFSPEVREAIRACIKDAEEARKALKLLQDRHMANADDNILQAVEGAIQIDEITFNQMELAKEVSGYNAYRKEQIGAHRTFIGWLKDKSPCPRTPKDAAISQEGSKG